MVVIVVLVVAILSLQLWLETPNSTLGVGYEYLCGRNTATYLPSKYKYKRVHAGLCHYSCPLGWITAEKPA